jgi:hypothetical protein
MTEHHHFMTYTQIEKTYRRMLARRMPGRQKRPEGANSVPQDRGGS